MVSHLPGQIGALCALHVCYTTHKYRRETERTFWRLVSFSTAAFQGLLKISIHQMSSSGWTGDTLPARISDATTSHTFGQHLIRYLRTDAVIRLVSFADINSAIDRDNRLSNSSSLKRYLADDEKKPLMNRIKSQARRLFLMCISEGLSMDYLHGLLQVGVTDAVVQPSSFADTTERETFEKYRWIFEQPMKLDNYSFGTSIPNHSPVPINFDPLEAGTYIAVGSSATIYRAQFDKRYCDIPNLEKNETDHILTEFCAIKVFNDSPEALACAEREMAFAAWLASCSQLRDDPHITKTFLGFSYRNRRYLISELGAMPLYYLLQDEKAAAHDMVWLRTQIIGLTRALAYIHGPTKGRTASHNDIQPYNILVFPNEGNNLKPTDWGRADFEDTSNSQHASSELTDASSRELTKPSDDGVYLGYVFVELLVWFYDGPERLQKTLVGDWSIVDPRNLKSHFLEPWAQKVLDQLRGRGTNMPAVMDVIASMINGKPMDRMNASEALRSFEDIPDSW